MTVLFCWALALPAWAGQGDARSVVIVNNAALSAGQSMDIVVTKTDGGKPKTVKTIHVGPVDADCRHGCGSDSSGFDAADGDYKITVSGGDASLYSAKTFKKMPGQEYVWMVSNRTAPPSIRAVAPGVVTLGNAGPYRIDLVTYTKTDVPAAAVQPRKAPKKNVWSLLKPNNNPRRGVND